MIIAAVVDSKDFIRPIIEGGRIRIYDTDTKEYTDYDNPANHLTEGRRGAALRFVKEKGATAFVSPPQTFCELSYNKAREDVVFFIPLEESVLFSEFQRLIDKEEFTLETELDLQNIVPSN